MATDYKLYDIGSVTDSSYLYKAVYRINHSLTRIDRYELMVARFNVDTGIIDADYGQNQQGVFRAILQLNPSFPIDYERLCPGIMMDKDNLVTFAGIAYMASVGNHGFFIAKLDNTGNVATSYGQANVGISAGSFTENAYSCTKELLIDQSNNCIFGVSTRNVVGDISSPSYISRRLPTGLVDNSFGNNGKVQITHNGINPQLTSLTFDNYGNYYAGYNALNQDQDIYGSSYIKSYNYSGQENTYFSKNEAVIINPGHNFISEIPKALGDTVRDYYLNYVTTYLPMDSFAGSKQLQDDVSNKEITFYGNAEISATVKKYGASSLKLDGINQSYVEVGGDSNNSVAASPLDFNLGTNGDFCIEGWFLFKALGHDNVLFSLGGPNTTNGLIMSIKNDASSISTLNLTIGNSDSNSEIINMTALNNSISLETWQHIAVTRKDFGFALYVDGHLKATGYSESQFNLTNSGGFKLGANQSGEQVLFGFIDDFRITQGHVRYFDRFKPSNYPISNVGENSDVKLLLHFEGDNNSKEIIDRGVSKLTATSRCVGNAKISSDYSKFGGTSLYLDGTNSYCEVDNSAITWPNSFYNNPFTIEAWVYFSEITPPNKMNIFAKDESMEMYFDNDGTNDYVSVNIVDILDTTRTFRSVSPVSITTGNWYHFALVKNGTSLKTFINGEEAGSHTIVNTLKSTLGLGSNPWVIGAGINENYLNGYIDEFRITASAVYTSSFNPKPHQFFPTQEHVITSNDQYAAQDALLLHFEESNGGQLVDSSDSNYTVSLHQDGSLDSTTARFGSKSLRVPIVNSGGSHGAKVNSSGSLNLSNDYTIETYFKLNSDVTEERIILEIRNSDNISNSNPAGGFQIRLNEYTDAGSEPINVVYMGSGDLLPIRGANLYSKDIWYHIAVVRQNTDVSCYLNGSLLLKKTFANDIDLSVYGDVFVGGGARSTANKPQGLNIANWKGNPLDGVIDELRITNGVARYLTNFTPQSTAFRAEPVAAPEPQYVTPDYANSKLLLQFDDLSKTGITTPEDNSGQNIQCNVVVKGDRRTSGRNTTITKFGGQSWEMNANQFANSTNHLIIQCQDDNLVLGSGDFTIELWVYKTSVEQRMETILAMGINNEDPIVGGMPFQIYINALNQGGNIVASLVTSNGGNPSWTGPDFTPYLNQWVHIAFVRKDGNATLYLNGQSVESKANPVNLTTNKLFIGGKHIDLSPSEFFRGYIDELHIRSSAVYSANFTPSSYAFNRQPSLAANVTTTSNYFRSKSELRYMVPYTQTSSFLVLANKVNNNGTSYAEILNIKHDGSMGSWGTNGVASLSAPGYGYVKPHVLWLDRELNLYVGGQAKKSLTGKTDGVVWKLDENGQVDSNFGTNGLQIKDNSSKSEAITSIINKYSSNEMIYTSIYIGDSSSPYNNIPVMGFGTYSFGGDLNFLTNYNFISKQLIPNEGVNRVLQEMQLTEAAHIKMPTALFNNLFKNSFDEVTQRFTTDNITLNVDQAINDTISVVSGGLVMDYWNHFINKVESRLPSNKRNLWDDSSTGPNSYSDAKLQNFFRDIGLGELRISNINDVLREYETNAVALFPHRVTDGVATHKREGFQAGDKAGITNGVEITFSATISAATGGTVEDTVISETRSFNLILELE